MRRYLADWAKLRTEVREKQVMEISPALAARIQGLAPSYKDVALQFVDKFKSVEMEAKEFEGIFSWFLDALENATLRSILEKLRTTDIGDLQQLDDLLSKMEVRTAVTLIQIIDSNLAAIDTLEKMHRQDARERGVIAKHLEHNPWLLDATWMLNKPEARVSTWIKDQFGLEPTGAAGDKDRVDFFCVGVSGTLHIVEIKRGAHIATLADVNQADKYRKYVERRFAEITDPNAHKYSRVQSHIIAAGLRDDAESVTVAFADQGWVFFTTWDDLIERAKQSHHQFRTILQRKAEETGEVTEPASAAKPKRTAEAARKARNKAKKKAARRKK